MKKIFVLLLAFVGVLTVFASPAEIAHAETIEIAPLCIIAPNPIYRTAVNTSMSTTSGGGTTMPGATFIPAGTQVGGTGNRTNERTQVVWNGLTGWILNRHLTRISC